MRKHRQKEPDTTEDERLLRAEAIDLYRTAWEELRELRLSLQEDYAPLAHSFAVGQNDTLVYNLATAIQRKYKTLEVLCSFQPRSQYALFIEPKMPPEPGPDEIIKEATDALLDEATRMEGFGGKHPYWPPVRELIAFTEGFLAGYKDPAHELVAYTEGLVDAYKDPFPFE